MPTMPTWFLRSPGQAGRISRYAVSLFGTDGFSDDVLLQPVGNGCEECFALLLQRYFRQVFALAFKILRERSEAEDILQEVFLATFLQRSRYCPISPHEEPMGLEPQ